MKCSCLNFGTNFRIIGSISPTIDQKETAKSIHLSHIPHFAYVFLAKSVLLRIIIYPQTFHSSGCLKIVLLKFQRHHKHMPHEYFV